MSAGAPPAPPVMSGATPEAARAGLVLVHGRGASARDILRLGEAVGLPDLALAAPEAPGRSWWPTSFLAPMDVLAAHVEAGLAAVDAAVASLTARGLQPERIALVGFSQGGCLVLEHGARRGGRWAGVFGLSGGLVGTADAGLPSAALYGHADKRFDYDARLDGVPVRLSVHTQDPHIPLKRVEDSAAVLARLGARVRTEVARGAGHGLLPGDIAALRALFNTPAAA